MSLLYIVEDEPILAECMALGISNLTGKNLEIEIFNDAVSAVDAVSERLPDVIMLDVMLSGPDGFAMLNELISYYDTATIPVILVTTLKLQPEELKHYGVVSVLNKATMTPEDMYAAVQDALKVGEELRSQSARQEPVSSAQPAGQAQPALADQARSASTDQQPKVASEQLAGLSSLNQKLSQEANGE